MSSPYESSYYNVAALGDLPAGKPRVFRAAGATVVLRREGDEVAAIDGSCLAEDGEMLAETRVQRILDGLATGSGSTSREWNDLHARAGLAVRVEDDRVWVCIEGCKPLSA